MGGGTRQSRASFITGLVPGDRASFECYYSTGRTQRPKSDPTHRGTRSWLYTDALLWKVQRRNFYQLHAEASHRGHYYHEYCMSISVDRDSPTNQDMTADAEEIVIEALRDLAVGSIASLSTSTNICPRMRWSTSVIANVPSPNLAAGLAGPG